MSPNGPETAAFETLVRAHQRDVLSYCARRATRADAWDAASEVFLVAWRRIDDIPSEAEVRAWLFGIAYKVISNQRRSARRRRRLFEKASAETMSRQLVDEPVVASPVDDELIEALSRLKAADREVLQMSLWEELSREEIAEALGISTEAVHKRYSRAKRRMRDELAEKSAMKGLCSRPHVVWLTAHDKRESVQGPNPFPPAPSDLEERLLAST